MGNALYEEIEKDDILGVKRIIDKKPELIDKFFNKEKTSNPISRAVWRNSAKIVEYLILKGANVNIELKTNGLFYPILIACLNRDLNMIKILVDNKANIYICDINGYTPLDYCIINGVWDCSKYFVNIGLKPKSKEFYELNKDNFIDRYINYEFFIEELVSDRDYNKEQVNQLFFNEFEKLKDPIQDPNETWKEFILRTINFGQAPLVERDSVAHNQKPENKGQIKKLLTWNQTYINYNKNNVKSIDKNEKFTFKDNNKLNELKNDNLNKENLIEKQKNNIELDENLSLEKELDQDKENLQILNSDYDDLKININQNKIENDKINEINI